MRKRLVTDDATSEDRSDPSSALSVTLLSERNQRMTVRYRFHTLLGSGELVAVWIDGRLVHSAGFPDNRSPGTDLVAGHRHRIRVEYINPDGRAELKLLWSSRVMDPISLNIKHLHPDTTAIRGIE